MIDNVKIILTEEGLETYALFEQYKTYKRASGVKELFDEVYLLDSSSKFSNVSNGVCSINLLDYLDDEENYYDFKKDLNKLFDYYHERAFDKNVIFFDQSLSIDRVLCYKHEKHYLNNLKKTIGIFDFAVKSHPRDKLLFKYNGLNFDLIKQRHIPWEVIYFNNYSSKNSTNKKNIYLTFSSTAVFNIRKLFNDVNNHIILLHELLYNSYEVNMKITEPQNNQFKRIIESYGSQNVYVPQNFSHLRQILHDISEVDSADNILESAISESKKMFWYQHTHTDVIKLKIDSIISIISIVSIKIKNNLACLKFLYLLKSKHHC